MQEEIQLLKRVWYHVGEELKNENLVSNDLIKVKLPPQQNNNIDLSRVSHRLVSATLRSEEEQTPETSAS